MRVFLLTMLLTIAVLQGTDELPGFPIETGASALESPPAYLLRRIAVAGGDSTLYIAEVADSASPISVHLDGAVRWGIAAAESAFIVQTTNGWLYRIELSGSIRFATRLGENSEYTAPIITDFDRDGEDEIVALADTSVFIVSIRGEVTHLADFSSEYGAVSAPAVGDIDDDGEYEIVVESWDALYAFHYDGTLCDGFPADLPYPYNYSYSSPALVDIDGDGAVEIVSSAHETEMDSWGAVFVHENDGELAVGWPFAVPDTGSWIYGGVVPADMNLDGSPELCTVDLSGRLHILTNERIALLSYATGAGELEGTPLVIDLDRDGAPDMLFTSGNGTGNILDRNSSGFDTDSIYLDTDGDYGITSPTLFAINDTFYCCAVNYSGGVYIWRFPVAPRAGAARSFTWREDYALRGSYPEPPSEITIDGDTAIWHSPVGAPLVFEEYALYIDDVLFYMGNDTNCVLPDSMLGDTAIVVVTAHYGNGLESSGAIDTIYPEEISEGTNLPAKTVLGVYPNPFNSSVKITVGQTFLSVQNGQTGMSDLPVTIAIYDLQGHIVGAGLAPALDGKGADLDRATARVAPTNSIFIWTPNKSNTSGMYIVRATTQDGRTITKRVVYLK